MLVFLLIFFKNKFPILKLQFREWKQFPSSLIRVNFYFKLIINYHLSYLNFERREHVLLLNQLKLIPIAPLLRARFLTLERENQSISIFQIFFFSPTISPIVVRTKKIGCNVVNRFEYKESIKSTIKPLLWDSLLFLSSCYDRNNFLKRFVQKGKETTSSSAREGERNIER